MPFLILEEPLACRNFVLYLVMAEDGLLSLTTHCINAKKYMTERSFKKDGRQENWQTGVKELCFGKKQYKINSSGG